MDVIAVWSVAFAILAADLPARELRALAKQINLPPGVADQWDAIGTYKLKRGQATTIVKLYYADSDSIAKKVERQGGVGFRPYPNFFSLHGVYRQGDGPWKHKKLYGVARAGFWKVTEVKPDAVTIQVRSKAIIFLNGSVRFSEAELKRMYKPVPMQLILKDGVPVLK